MFARFFKPVILKLLVIRQETLKDHLDTPEISHSKRQTILIENQKWTTNELDLYEDCSTLDEKKTKNKKWKQDHQVSL